MFRQSYTRVIAILLLAGVFSGTVSFSTSMAQSAPATSQPAAPVLERRLQPAYMPDRAYMHYAGAWGIEPVSVKLAESGEMVRFTWRVLDPSKAAALNDKSVDPVLIDPQRGISLVVPSVEQVGTLRQAPTKIDGGKTYWMVFANTGRPVKHGDQVIVKIGNFRAEGLIVE
jgi:hypothetical protein